MYLDSGVIENLNKDDLYTYIHQRIREDAEYNNTVVCEKCGALFPKQTAFKNKSKKYTLCDDCYNFYIQLILIT